MLANKRLLRRHAVRVRGFGRDQRSITSSSPPAAATSDHSALKGLRRRRVAAQRQAAPLRFGATLDPHTKGFTLTALLGACGGDLQGLRDAALLSLGYDAGLRVSELVAVTVAHIDPHSDGSALLFIPSSKTDQEGQGAWGWLSPDTMRRVGAWLVASAITEGPVFRRVGVDRRRLRAAVAPMAYEAIPGHTRHWQEKLRGKKAEPARTVYTVGTASLTRQGVNGIYRRVALSAFDQGLVEMPIGKVEEAARALSSHSLRVGCLRICSQPARTVSESRRRCAGRRRRPRCAMVASLLRAVTSPPAFCRGSEADGRMRQLHDHDRDGDRRSPPRGRRHTVIAGGRLLRGKSPSREGNLLAIGASGLLQRFARPSITYPHDPPVNFLNVSSYAYPYCRK
jgi:hypothetical protein